MDDSDLEICASYSTSSHLEYNIQRMPTDIFFHTLVLDVENILKKKKSKKERNTKKKTFGFQYHDQQRRRFQYNKKTKKKNQSRTWAFFFIIITKKHESISWIFADFFQNLFFDLYMKLCFIEKI